MENKMNELKKQVQDFYVNRLVNYGVSGYQRISNDWYLKNIPDELLECWYGEGVSFVGLIEDYKTDIDKMTYEELFHLFAMEKWLDSRLEKIFSKLHK